CRIQGEGTCGTSTRMVGTGGIVINVVPSNPRLRTKYPEWLGGVSIPTLQHEFRSHGMGSIGCNSNIVCREIILTRRAGRKDRFRLTVVDEDRRIDFLRGDRHSTEWDFRHQG